MELMIAAGVVVVGLGSYAALIAAIRQYETPRPPAVLTLAWVHEGLVEPEPFDRRLLVPPPLTGGGPTGAWPMIWELRKETPALPGRERFAGPPTIEGEVVEQPQPAQPWLRRPTIAVEAVVERDIAVAVRAMVLAGAQ